MVTPLPPLATVPELATWLGITLDNDDPRAMAVLDAASTLVRAYTENDWLVDNEAQVYGPNDVDAPAEVHTVTLSVAGRAWQRPDDVESSTEAAGPYSYTRRYTGETGALYLTSTEKMMLARHRKSVAGLAVLSTTRGDEYDLTGWVPVEGAEYPFPWYALGDPVAGTD